MWHPKDLKPSAFRVWGHNQSSIIPAGSVSVCVGVAGKRFCGSELKQPHTPTCSVSEKNAGLFAP